MEITPEGRYPGSASGARRRKWPRPGPIVVRNRAFGRLWISQFQSNLGTWLLVVAVPVYVFQLTGSPTSTSIAVVAEAAPALMFAPLGGLLADRWSRRLVMAGSDAVRMACVLGMLLASRAGLVWVVYAAVFAENGVAQFFDPAYGAIVPQIVGRSADLDEASSWSSAASGAVRLAGGPVGGLLYGVVGFRWLVAADAATYLISALLLLGIAVPPTRPNAPGAPRSRSGLLAELAGGVAFLRRDIVLRRLLMMSALFLFGNGALSAILVPYAERALHRGAGTIGLLMSALGAGYLAGAYVGRRLTRTGRLRHGTACCLAAVTGAFAGLFNCDQIGLALMFIALAGVPGAALLLLVRVQVQRKAPDLVLGRVMAAYGAMQTAATVLGAATGGVLAARCMDLLQQFFRNRR